MSESNQKSKVSIEDLIRLKRAEKPAAEFWSTFEQELRQKQLFALVEKRVWWQGIPSFLVRRFYLPVGAAAIVAFSLFSVRQNSSVPSAPSDREAALPPSTLSPVVEAAEPVNLATITIDSPTAVLPAVALAESNRHEATVPQVVNAVPVPTRSSQDFVSGTSPSARSIAANLARLEQSEPELLNAVLGTRLSSPTRVVATPAVAELASLQLSGAKRARLLAHYNDRQPSADLVAPDSVRERISRRLSENELNDRLSRIGLKADQVSLKF